MRLLYPLTLLAALFSITGTAETVRVTNGCWWSDAGFVCENRWVTDGVFVDRPAEDADSSLDARGRYLLPAFGEAHNHNLAEARAPMFSNAYLAKGIFYVQVPGNSENSRGEAETRLGEQRVDASYANGLFTAPGGHPWGLVRRNENLGIFTVGSAEGDFIRSVVSDDDIARIWPDYLAGSPDFLKVVLVFSEDHEERAGSVEHFSWYGIDPARLPGLVERAHEDGLPVMAHVETAADFRHAVAAGVDQVGHLPGFRYLWVPGDRSLDIYELSEVDARAAADAGITVVTTVGGIVDALLSDPGIEDRDDGLAMLQRNIQRLMAAGVSLAFGSDNYQGDSAQEARAMLETGWMTPAEIIRAWSQVTPRVIFPKRRVGCLEKGCEADFIGVDANPLQDPSTLFAPSLRVKGGVSLPDPE